MMTFGGRYSPVTCLIVLLASLGGWIVNGFVPVTHRPTTVSISTSSRSTPTKLAKEWSYSSRSQPLAMSSDPQGEGKQSNLPFWLDVNTKGGAIVISIILFVVPILIYSFVTSVLGFDEIEAGKWIGVGFTAIATFLWVGTYIFRVATKDMTYVSFIHCN